MTLTNVFGEVDIEDYVLAAWLAYSGYPLVKTESSFNGPKWTFRCPEEDLKICMEEKASEETTCHYRGLYRAIKMLNVMASKARNNGGIWTCGKGWFVTETLLGDEEEKVADE